MIVGSWQLLKNPEKSSLLCLMGAAPAIRTGKELSVGFLVRGLMEPEPDCPRGISESLHYATTGRGQC